MPLRFQRGEERIDLSPMALNGAAVNESTAHLTALRNGLGVGQTLELMTGPYVQRGEMVGLFREWSRPHQPVHVLYPRNRHPGARLKAFIGWVGEVFSTHDAL